MRASCPFLPVSGCGRLGCCVMNEQGCMALPRDSWWRLASFCENGHHNQVFDIYIGSTKLVYLGYLVPWTIVSLWPSGNTHV